MPQKDPQPFSKWWKAQAGSTRIILLGAAVVVLVLIGSSLTGGDPASPKDASTPQPTSPPATSLQDQYGGQASVYSRIASTTDCTALQNEFDIAADNNDRADPGTAEHKWTLGYMKAADNRMRAIGCY